MSKFQLIAVVAVCALVLMSGVARADDCSVEHCQQCVSGNPQQCLDGGCATYFYSYGGTCIPCSNGCMRCISVASCYEDSCDPGYTYSLGYCVRKTVPVSAASSLSAFGLAVLAVLATVAAYLLV